MSLYVQKRLAKKFQKRTTIIAVASVRLYPMISGRKMNLLGINNLANEVNGFSIKENKSIRVARPIKLTILNWMICFKKEDPFDSG